MGGLCKLLGVLAIIGTLFGLVPFLGWLNWLNLPLAFGSVLLGVLVWALSGNPSTKSGGKAGAILGLVSVGVGLVRLALGGGVI